MIEIKNLTAGYDGEEKLHRINLTVKGGELLALVGPNGSGKSTLLKAVCGVLKPCAGSVVIDGKKGLCGKALAKMVSVLPQGRETPAITVRRMVLHGRFPHLGYPRVYRPCDFEIAQTAMEQTGVWALRDKLLTNLSGGERQRVYLAMVLAQETPVVLLDEPTTYLDIGRQIELMELIGTMRIAGKSVLMVLHDLSLALRFADKIAVLDRGALKAVDRPENILPAIDAAFGVTTITGASEVGNRWYSFH